MFEEDDLLSHITPLKGLVPQEHRRRFLSFLRRHKKSWLRDLKPGDEVLYWDFDRGNEPIKVTICSAYTPGSKREYKRCDCPCDRHSKIRSPVELVAGSNYTHIWIWVHLPVDLSVKGSTKDTPGAQYKAWPTQFFLSEKEAWQAWLTCQYNSELESSLEFEERMIEQDRKQFEAKFEQRKKQMFAFQRMNDVAISKGGKMPKKRKMKVTCWRASTLRLKT